MRDGLWIASDCRTPPGPKASRRAHGVRQVNAPLDDAYRTAYAGKIAAGTRLGAATVRERVEVASQCRAAIARSATAMPRSKNTRHLRPDVDPVAHAPGSDVDATAG